MEVNGGIMVELDQVGGFASTKEEGKKTNLAQCQYYFLNSLRDLKF